jgi:hypothetical protein
MLSWIQISQKRNFARAACFGMKTVQTMYLFVTIMVTSKKPFSYHTCYLGTKCAFHPLSVFMDDILDFD